ncbi:MAG: sigma-54-dependent transcriptional regulator [Christensenellales bacterium]
MRNESVNILIVDDEADYRDTLSIFFEALGYSTEKVKSAEDALKLLDRKFFPIIVTDMMMDGMSGIDLLKIVKKEYADEIEVIMVTGYGSIETAVETIKTGAFGYFIKSHNPKELQEEVERAAKSMEIRKWKSIEASKMNFVVSSKNPKMAKIWALVEKLADSDANVLITGESGTGKEIMANRIHELSGRKNEAFVPINCQSIPASLIESELFGHEKGAFTGANESHKGKLEKGNMGTIFLDEIGDMSTDMQGKLLRVLENHQIERVGSNVSIDVNFRVISATNKPLSDMVKEGYFRGDLMYRINTFEIDIPPLRERREDIPTFVNYFTRRYVAKTGKCICGISEDTWQFLLNYNYPGNVRELKNMIERMVILAPKDGILHMDEKKGVGYLNEIEDMGVVEPYRDAKRKWERNYIIGVLDKEYGNITKAADIMELSRRQLFNKMKELNIKIN